MDADARVTHVWHRHLRRTPPVAVAGIGTAGLTGNIIFTEFGLFPRGGQAHWRVIFPLATRGFMVIVISTPR